MGGSGEEERERYNVKMDIGRVKLYNYTQRSKVERNVRKDGRGGKVMCKR